MFDSLGILTDEPNGSGAEVGTGIRYELDDVEVPVTLSSVLSPEPRIRPLDPHSCHGTVIVPTVLSVHTMEPTVSECPLCGFDGENRDDLRVHLHSSHLKSEIIDVYLDAVAE